MQHVPLLFYVPLPQIPQILPTLCQYSVYPHQNLQILSPLLWHFHHKRNRGITITLFLSISVSSFHANNSCLLHSYAFSALFMPITLAYYIHMPSNRKRGLGWLDLAAIKNHKKSRSLANDLDLHFQLLATAPRS